MGIVFPSKLESPAKLQSAKQVMSFHSKLYTSISLFNVATTIFSWRYLTLISALFQLIEFHSSLRFTFVSSFLILINLILINLILIAIISLFYSLAFFTLVLCFTSYNHMICLHLKLLLLLLFSLSYWNNLLS